MNREHSKVWHKVVKHGMDSLGLGKDGARARASEMAQAHKANLKKLAEEGRLSELNLSFKIDFGEDID